MLESTDMFRIRTRIAPSPTGEDLHIGNAYTALINSVYAKKHQGKFIIRIEDTDRTRFVEGSEGRILKSLEWLGLKSDENPVAGGPYAPYRQSERLELYKKYAEDLISRGKAYYCFCSPERLEEMRQRQTEKKEPTIYDGHCREIPPDLARKRAENEKHVVRLNVPDEGITEFTDIIRGKISFENKLIDDQVILKSDGFPTYHLGVVVDDHLMEISHIIRGEEWISSAPKHIILYKAFGWDIPEFAHLPLLRNPDKSKLSKRKNPVWVSWYREQGILPEALVNYLALMGWSMPDGRDKFSVKEMMAEFKLDDIKTTAPIFDYEKLKWLNKRYLQELPHGEFEKLVSGYSNFSKKTNFPTLLPRISPLIKPRISILSEFDNFASVFFEKPDKWEMDLTSKKEILVKLREVLTGHKEWQAQSLGKIMQDLVSREKYKSSDFFMAVRVALTGKKITPPLNETMEILGKEEVLTRLQSALTNALRS